MILTKVMAASLRRLHAFNDELSNGWTDERLATFKDVYGDDQRMLEIEIRSARLFSPLGRIRRTPVSN